MKGVLYGAGVLSDEAAVPMQVRTILPLSICKNLWFEGSVDPAVNMEIKKNPIK